jgi:2-aminoadipate transaminase
MVAHEVGKAGFLDEHVKLICQTYHERRDVMLEMMSELFPPEVRWTKPQGGMFLWGILPKNIDSSEVLKAAIERKVAFVPGGPFHTDGSGKNTMRLNFSYSTPEIIREGITRLGLLLREQVGKGS